LTYIIYVPKNIIYTKLRYKFIIFFSLQGVIVLSRQWKNVLYTPLLLEHNYKTKHVKPLNVTFAVSDPDEVKEILNTNREIVKPYYNLINNDISLNL